MKKLTIEHQATTVVSTVKPSTSSTPPSTTLVPVTTSRSSSSTTSSSESLTWTPTPVTSLQTITGQVQTVTVTPTTPPTSIAQQQPTTGSNSLLSNAGKVAGLFTGLALLILLIAGISLFCCWRRRQHRSVVAGTEASTGDSTPRPRSRSMSQLGLINDGGSKGKQLPRISTGMWSGADTSGDSRESPQSTDRRNSQAKIVDQRLDPGQLWNPYHENSSRVSVKSLQDDRDYSRRVLKVSLHPFLDVVWTGSRPQS